MVNAKTRSIILETTILFLNNMKSLQILIPLTPLENLNELSLSNILIFLTSA